MTIITKLLFVLVLVYAAPTHAQEIDCKPEGMSDAEVVRISGGAITFMAVEEKT